MIHFSQAIWHSVDGLEMYNAPAPFSPCHAEAGSKL